MCCVIAIDRPMHLAKPTFARGPQRNDIRLSPCRQYSDPLHSVLSFSCVSRRYCLRCVRSVARTVIMLQFACKTRKHHNHFATFSLRLILGWTETLFQQRPNGVWCLSLSSCSGGMGDDPGMPPQWWVPQRPCSTEPVVHVGMHAVVLIKLASLVP